MGELHQRHREHPLDFGRIRGELEPVREHPYERGDRSRTRYGAQRGETPHYLHHSGVDADLLPCLAQRGFEEGLPLVETAARKRHLVRVRSQPGGSPGQDYIGLTGLVEEGA